MAIDRPDDLPTWAEAPPDPGNVVEAPTVKQDQGWLFRDPPPFQLVNWFWRQVTRWLAHFADTASGFDTPADAYLASLAGSGSPFSLGGTCIVRGSTVARAEEIATTNLSAFVPGTNDVIGSLTGNFIAPSARGPVVALLDANQYSVVRLSVDLQTVVVTYFTGAAFQEISRQLLTDGVHVVFGVDNEIREYDYETGALLQATPLLGFDRVRGVAWTRDYIFAATHAPSNEVQRVTRTTSGGAGSVDWGFDHGGLVSSIAAYEEGGTGIETPGHVAFLGAASTHASGATLRVINFDGWDDQNEGGLGFWTDGWHDTEDGISGSIASLVQTDGRHLFYVRTPIAGDFLQRRSLIDGGGLVSREVYPGVPANFLYGTAIDQDFFFVRFQGAGQDTVAFDKRTMDLAWRIRGTGPYLGSDGHAIYTGSGSTLRRKARGTKSQIWRRVDPLAEVGLRPFRDVMIPEGGV